MEKTEVKHRRYYENALWQYGLQFTKYVFPLLVIPYLTRILKPEGYALFAYVQAFMTFAMAIAEFGFNLSGTKKIAAEEDRGRLSRIVGSITQARILLCVALGLAVFGIVQFIPLMRNHPAYSTLAYLAICGKALVPDFVFMGKEKMAPLTTRFVVSKGVSTALTFVFVHSFSDILWIPVLDIVANIIALAWSFVAMKRLFGIGIQVASLRESLADLKLSGIYCISELSTQFFSGFSTLLIGILIADPVQISYWSLAMTAVGGIQALFLPIITSLYPHMVRNFDFAFAKRIAWIALPVLVAGTVLFASLANPIVLLMGGQRYLPGSFILRIVAPVLLFSFYAMYFGWPVLGAAGKVNELTKTTFMSACISIVLVLAMFLSGHISVAAIAVIRTITEISLFWLRFRLCLRLPRRLHQLA